VTAVADAHRAPRRSRAGWVHGPRADVALAFAWVPFALAAHVLEQRPGRGLSVLVGATLVLSFTHQAPTLALVYGDPDQFRLHRRLFLISPFVFAAAALVFLQISPIVVALVAGLWNAEHTLMQRYGVTRIYGRKAGDDHGPLERVMLLSWLALALVWAATDLRVPAMLARVDLGSTNQQGIEILQRLRPAGLLLLFPAFTTAGALLLVWIAAERARGPAANPAKHVYVGATALLFVAVLVDPVAGFTGYVGAHALEYFAVVNQALGRRYGRGSTGGGPLGRAVRGHGGRVRVWAVYTAGVAALLLALAWASVLVGSVVYLTIGGLHVLWDGYIWKLRRPAVAASLAVPPVPALP
jgi:hypothetical protein